MPLVINSLGDGHTHIHTHAHIHTHKHTYTDIRTEKTILETSNALTCGWCARGLKANINQF